MPIWCMAGLSLLAALTAGARVGHCMPPRQPGRPVGVISPTRRSRSQEQETGMPRKNVPISIGLAIAILLGAGAATPTPSQDVGQRIMETLSPAAYQRIVPHLAALTTGDRIDQKIRWGFFGVLRGKLAPPLILASGWVASLSADFPLVLADGWVASLSGDFLGAHSGFGKLIGQ